MSSDVSCQKYPNPAGYEPCQTAAEKSNGPFFDPPIFGAVLKTSVRDVAGDGEGLSDVFFFARHHDQPRHRSDINFYFWTLKHWNWELVCGFKHFLFFHSVGNVIIPTDEVHHFSEGLFYHQPENLLLNIPKSRVKLADPQQHRVKVNHLVEHITRPGKRLQKLWTDPPCWMGKFTNGKNSLFISTGPFSIANCWHNQAGYSDF